MTNRRCICFLAFFSILMLLIRILFFDYSSGDYEIFLKPWVLYMRDNGGIFSLSESFTNYNLPYLTILALISYIPIEPLYLIKIVSILFDWLIALLGFKMVYQFSKEDKFNKGMFTYIILLFAPTVILNSSAWGQCDSIYTFFVLLSIYNMITEKYNKAFIYLGISFAFKLQFIFVFPLYVILFYCEKNIKMKHFAFIPLINFILCIPGTLVGASPFYTYKIYFLQAGYYKKALNVANMYSFFPSSEVINIIGVCVTLVLFILLLIYCIRSGLKYKAETILTLSLLSVLICYFFLPCMHERYMYIADIISIIWYKLYKRKIYIPIIINLVSLITYLGYLAYIPFKRIIFMILSPLLLIGIILLLFDFNRNCLVYNDRVNKC